MLSPFASFSPVGHPRGISVAPAITLIAHVGVTGGGNGAGPTAAINTTGANFCVVAAVSLSASAAPGISDSKGNIYSVLTSYTNVVGFKTTIYYCANATCGTGHTFTSTGLSTYSSIGAAAFSNVKTASPFDAENGASATGTTIQPGSVTPSVGGELLFTGLGLNQTGSSSIDNSFTVLDQMAYGAGVNFGLATAYRVQSSAAAINPTWTTATGALAVSIATFKPA